LLSANPNRNLISNIGFSADATNATADPLGIAGPPLEGIEFPLEHPAAVRRDEEADALASRFFRRPAPPLWHRIAARLGGGRSGGGRELSDMASSQPDPGFWSGKSVAVTGGAGFLGTPTVALLDELGAEVRTIRSAEHALRDRAACFDALEGAQVVIHLAANVGGIGYNRRNQVPLAHDNLAMELNVFDASRELGVEKLVAACSVCAYPKITPVP